MAYFTIGKSEVETMKYEWVIDVGRPYLNDKIKAVIKSAGLEEIHQYNIEAAVNLARFINNFIISPRRCDEHLNNVVILKIHSNIVSNTEIIEGVEVES